MAKHTKPPKEARKRPLDKNNWAKVKAKARRYAPARPPNFPLSCSHKETKSGKSTYECQTLNMQDVCRFHQAFYCSSDKLIQDNFILKYTRGAEPKRRRSVTGRSMKTFATKFFVKRTRRDTGSKDVQVCQKAFLSILGLSKHRVQGVIKRHKATGCSPKEKRGGDTRSKKYAGKKAAVIKFINQLQPYESHYCRGKSSKKYLSSELSIRKLWRMYNTEHQVKLHVLYDYFRLIFITKFNISFNTPATDACSTCISLQERMKTAVGTQKDLLRTEYRVHKLKAKAFYEMLKQCNEDEVYFSFDCQKNMPLPKVPDQSAYYARQLYMYNLTICQGHSKEKQTHENITICNWLESDLPKSSNEIVSAVYDRLLTVDLSNRKVVKLFADGASGQNKNSSMIYMLGYWLMNKAPPEITKVEIVFPVVGHSFLPPDRVFGRLEQIIKKKSTIITPDEYKEIFGSAGTVKEVGGDIKVYNFKGAAATVLKKTTNWHFKFQPSKRITLKRNKLKTHILVRGKVNYKSDLLKFMSICKTGQKFTVFPEEIPKGSFKVKPAKLKDVDNLLQKHFGEKWKDEGALGNQIFPISYYCSTILATLCCQRHETL